MALVQVLLCATLCSTTLGLRAQVDSDEADELRDLTSFEAHSIKEGVQFWPFDSIKEPDSISLQDDKTPSYAGKDFMYLQPPHTATVTVLNGLAQALGFDEKQMANHHSHSQLEKRIDMVGGYDKFKEQFSFTFVRSPWERVLSCAGWKGAIDGGKVNLQRTHSENVMAFREFVKKSAKRCLKYMHHQVNYTHAFTPSSPTKRKQVLSFVGRVSNLEADLSKVTQMMGLKSVDLSTVENHCVTHCPEAGDRKVDAADLAKQNKKVKYTEFYDDETQQIVADMWDDDIRAFGFKFGE